MDPKYDELRHTIAQTKDEISRFRQLVINCVLAVSRGFKLLVGYCCFECFSCMYLSQTDIVDKELKQLRNNRWSTAFSGEIDETEERAVNRKATIVIERELSRCCRFGANNRASFLTPPISVVLPDIIQASDIGHTMQQWRKYPRTKNPTAFVLSFLTTNMFPFL